MTEIWKLLAPAWSDMVRNWAKLLAADVVFKLAAFTLLNPVVGIALRTVGVRASDCRFRAVPAEPPPVPPPEEHLE